MNERRISAGAGLARVAGGVCLALSLAASAWAQDQAAPAPIEPAEITEVGRLKTLYAKQVEAARLWKERAQKL